MERKVEVKRVVLIFLVTIMLIVLLGILFYKNINRSITIKARVKYVGDDYIIVTDKDNNEEYLLDTEAKYNVSDELIVTMDNINDNVNPKEARIKVISVTSRTLSFTIHDDNQVIDNNEKEDNVNNNSGDEVNEVASDEEIVEYFDSVNKSIDSTNIDNTTLSRIKEGFVNIVDFLFYDKEIKGKTFKELGLDAKLKILKIALSIDGKIDNKIPGYKEKLELKYQDIKSKIVGEYLDITSDICSKHADGCDEAKRGLSEMKNDFSITWSFIKNIAGVSVNKLKNWYEVWRGV